MCFDVKDVELLFLDIELDIIHLKKLSIDIRNKFKILPKKDLFSTMVCECGVGKVLWCVPVSTIGFVTMMH